MKILYATDIHGSRWKYEMIFEVAENLEVDIVINGGDMLPFGDFLNQDKFIKNYLDSYFSKFNDNKIYYITMLANDDLLIFDELFNQICNQYKYVISIAQRRFKLQKYEFIGMNLVTDLPFVLKDRVRKDTENFTFPKQFGTAMISSLNGWKKIPDWSSYVANLPTIEEELNNLIIPDDIRNTIYIFHMPPANMGLDVCYDGRKVGSKAIYNFISKYQPLLTLHGHIHESPETSGKWHAYLNETLCIQPGQSLFHEKYLIYALIDLETLNIERFQVKNLNNM
ncbi:MAG: metallophosphoesterase [Candidatus Hodarchaeota archaeon]